MNKVDLINKVAEKSGLTKKDAEASINATLETIQETLAKGEQVTVVGFGTFEVRDRKERNGRNPQTGETVTVPAGKTPAFKPGKTLKEAVKA